MLLQGYGTLLAAGALLTLKVALLSLLAAFVIGIAAASLKLSRQSAAAAIATAYTTVIRGIPDLVLMLLIYYSLQIWLNDWTDSLHLAQIDIDPFAAAVLTLGFIYGAYFAETLRGAFLSVPRGQMDAALAIGMKRQQAFRRILFPQMMRFALPGLTNNWLVLLKSAGLVSLLGLDDLVHAARQAGNATAQQFLFYTVVALVFLAFTTISQLALRPLQRAYSHGVRKAQL
jgi:histidine transport system permease protein